MKNKKLKNLIGSLRFWELYAASENLTEIACSGYLTGASSSEIYRACLEEIRRLEEDCYIEPDV